MPCFACCQGCGCGRGLQTVERRIGAEAQRPAPALMWGAPDASPAAEGQLLQGPGAQGHAAAALRARPRAAAPPPVFTPSPMRGQLMLPAAPSAAAASAPAAAASTPAAGQPPAPLIRPTPLPAGSAAARTYELGHQGRSGGEAAPRAVTQPTSAELGGKERAPHPAQSHTPQPSPLPGRARDPRLQAESGAQPQAEPEPEQAAFQELPPDLQLALAGPGKPAGLDDAVQALPDGSLEGGGGVAGVSGSGAGSGVGRLGTLGRLGSVGAHGRLGRLGGFGALGGLSEPGGDAAGTAEDLRAATASVVEGAGGAAPACAAGAAAAVVGSPGGGAPEEGQASPTSRDWQPDGALEDQASPTSRDWQPEAFLNDEGAGDGPADEEQLVSQEEQQQQDDGGPAPAQNPAGSAGAARDDRPPAPCERQGGSAEEEARGGPPQQPAASPGAAQGVSGADGVAGAVARVASLCADLGASNQADGGGASRAGEAAVASSCSQPLQPLHLAGAAAASAADGPEHGPVLPLREARGQPPPGAAPGSGGQVRAGPPSLARAPLHPPAKHPAVAASVAPEAAAHAGPSSTADSAQTPHPASEGRSALPEAPQQLAGEPSGATKRWGAAAAAVRCCQHGNAALYQMTRLTFHACLHAGPRRSWQNQRPSRPRPSPRMLTCRSRYR